LVRVHVRGEPSPRRPQEVCRVPAPDWVEVRHDLDVANEAGLLVQRQGDAPKDGGSEPGRVEPPDDVAEIAGSIPGVGLSGSLTSIRSALISAELPPMVNPLSQASVR
jgi:hypothetical protein